MIMLDDQHTKVPIPYAGVWATILNSAGKTVFSERQWPMISAYMGPHYGNNVHTSGRGPLHAEAAGQPAGRRASPRVRARLAEAAHGRRALHLEAHDMTARGVFTRRRFLAGAGGLVAAGVAAGVAIEQSASGSALPLADLPGPVSGLPARQHAWVATLTPDKYGNPTPPRFDRLLLFDVRGTPDPRYARLLEAELRKLEHAHPWTPQGLLFTAGWAPALLRGRPAVSRVRSRAPRRCRNSSSRRSTAITSACTWPPTIRRC